MTKNSKTHFDKIAERYREVPATWESVYAKARAIIEPLVRNRVVLDVGNGGYFPYDTAIPKKVIVLDISPSMLKKIEDPHVVKIVGDARDLDGVENESLDAALYLLSIHHINGRSVSDSVVVLDKVLGAAYRKLKPGGTLVVLEAVLGRFLFCAESLFFGITRRLLGLSKVPMVFFYSVPLLKSRLACQFKLEEEAVGVTSLPVSGNVDPFGGTFPGLVRIPARLCPTKYFLFEIRKAAE